MYKTFVFRQKIRYLKFPHVHLSEHGAASCLPLVCSACVRASVCGANSGLIGISWSMAGFPSDGALIGDLTHTYASFFPIRPSHPFLTFPLRQQKPVPQKVGQNPDFWPQASIHSAPSFMSPWFTAMLARGSTTKRGLLRALGLRSDSKLITVVPTALLRWCPFPPHISSDGFWPCPSVIPLFLTGDLIIGWMGNTSPNVKVSFLKYSARVWRYGVQVAVFSLVPSSRSRDGRPEGGAALPRQLRRLSSRRIFEVFIFWC